MDIEETCKWFSSWVNAVGGAVEEDLPIVKDLMKSGESQSAAMQLDQIRDTIDDMLHAFDRILILNGQSPRYKSIYK